MLGSDSSQAVHPAAQIHGLHPQQQTSVAMGLCRSFCREVSITKRNLYEPKA